MLLQSYVLTSSARLESTFYCCSPAFVAVRPPPPPAADAAAAMCNLSQRLQLAHYDDFGSGVLSLEQLQRYLADAAATAPLLAGMEVSAAIVMPAAARSALWCIRRDLH